MNTAHIDASISAGKRNKAEQCVKDSSYPEGQ